MGAVPWGLAVLPLLVLAGFLAARAAEEWPKVGFPACSLGVGLFVVTSGLFKSGVDWGREWRVLGEVTGAGMSPVLGTILAVGLGGAFLGILFLHADTVWRTLSSVRLAVVTLAAIGILSVIGTMVVQRFGAGALADREKDFVEKFMKGQGSIVPNLKFLLSPPALALTPGEEERIALTGKAFGEGKARQMRMNALGFREKDLKAMAIEKHVEARREELLRLFTRLDALGFTNVFRTWWFNSLLVLLFVQVCAVIRKRYPWGWMGAGWVAAHLGVLVILSGCVLSDGFLRDGSLALSPGESAEGFLDATLPRKANGEGAERALGYRVRMLGTDQSFYHELEILFPDAGSGNDTWTQEQLRPGRVIEVNDPQTGASYSIRVQETWERAEVETVMVSGRSVGRGDGIPALKVRFHGEDRGRSHLMDEGWLFSDGYYTGGPLRWLVRYVRAGTEEEARSYLDGSALKGQGKFGMLRVFVPGVNGALSLPATPEASASITAAEGAVWTFTVKRFVPSYFVGRPEGTGAGEGEFPNRPALFLEVRKGEDASPMVVYDDPDLERQWEDMNRRGSEAGAHGGGSGIGSGPAAEPRYAFDYSPPRRTCIVEGPGVPRTLVSLAEGEAPVTADFSRPGTTFPLGAQGLTFTLVEAIPDAVPDERIQPLPQETDEEYMATCLRTLETGVRPPPTVSVARIQVTEKDGAGTRVRERWLVAGKKGVMDPRTYESTDGRLLVVMAETKSAMMFRSALEVQTLDGMTLAGPDGKPLRHVVRVNHPLQWGGYAFYQNTFIAATPGSSMSEGSPEASVFRVKYDRGIPAIYSGFILLTAGVVTMLYINPLLRKRRRAADGGGDAAKPPREA